LEDRSAETFAEWLKQHPGVEIISRDRSKDDQRGATDGAPTTQQVIDRWHVLKNMREAVERFLRHSQEPEAARGATTPRQKRTSGERARSQGSRDYRLALYQQVQELYQQGGTILGIARQLHLGHRRVRTFVRSSSFPEWGKPARTKSAIDPYRPYLQERWQQGCHATGQLWQELQARGFSGSRMMVYRWVQRQNDTQTDPVAPLQIPPTLRLAPRPLSWLFLRNPEHLEKQDKQILSHICQAQQADVVYGLAQQFMTMVKERNAKVLEAWLRDCQKSGIGDLVTFAQGLEKERSALYAALTLPYSNGPVEGKINKLKSIKRSMYGRSGFPLLRQKVLKAA
jgi:transposase